MSGLEKKTLPHKQQVLVFGSLAAFLHDEHHIRWILGPKKNLPNIHSF